MRALTAILFVLAAACERAPDAAPAPAMTPAPAPPAAAVALAATFAPEVVGAITPAAVAPGDYAMALSLDAVRFATTELHLSDHVSGALQLTLAPDGTARGCIASIEDHASLGQWAYRPDHHNAHSATRESTAWALAGTWRVVDGVAAVTLDRGAWSTCDLAEASGHDTPLLALRCIGVAGSAIIPTGSLACTADPHRDGLVLGLGLGMPMSRAARAAHEPTPRAPAGPDFILGAPGLYVTVGERADADRPSFTIAAGPVAIDPKAYQPPPPSPRP